ncbi:hypothetical protein [Candidatus Accumulibacter cognatus]|uniref:hypothetical protein n=1 Tax=Candidatus Accumulibacter cognatus TaxID=2954383 RepID=UPI0004AF1B5E|nr:hypothetical protein [Candidatus Accumulibacter cognatus]
MIKELQRWLGVLAARFGVEKAAEAERRVTEEWRQLGNEALHDWARRQAQRKEEDVAQQPGVQRKEKTLALYVFRAVEHCRSGGTSECCREG